VNAIERLTYYGHELDREKAATTPNDPDLKVWPPQGKIEFQGLEIRYPSRPDVPVVQDVSLSIQPRERVGIVGRTGSGKSTLATALFRIIEFNKGTILIDGVGKGF
jgi:ABC-type multidrug transport system fused ATPase/permease subunit